MIYYYLYPIYRTIIYSKEEIKTNYFDHYINNNNDTNMVGIFNFSHYNNLYKENDIEISEFKEPIEFKIIEKYINNIINLISPYKLGPPNIQDLINEFYKYSPTSETVLYSDIEKLKEIYKKSNPDCTTKIINKIIINSDELEILKENIHMNYLQELSKLNTNNISYNLFLYDNYEILYQILELFIKCFIKI